MCLLVLYGHTARVWKAELLPQCIVSIGEDAVCRVWSHSGEVISTFRGHKGKSIWSMAVDKEHKILASLSLRIYYCYHHQSLLLLLLQATGGGDCSVRVYNLKDSYCPVSFHSWSPSLYGDSSVVPRCVFLMGQTALCLVDQG